MASIAPDRRGNIIEREHAALAANGPARDLLLEYHRDRPFDLIYERYSLWSYAAMELAREENIPSILEINAPILEELIRGRMLIDREGAEDATMRAFRAATAITVVSRELAHIIEKHPSARGKIHVVPNAANLERFSGATPNVPRTEEEFVVGFIGELLPWQGLPTLIAAFQLLADALPHARLVIAGEGSDREALERDIAARSLTQQVQLLGGVPPSAIPGVLASFDVAVAPFPQLAGFYGSPLKMYEYMAAGLAIVASRIGQVQEVLKHDRTALLVEPGDRQALAETLYELEQAPERRQQLGAAARSQLQADHTWDAVLARVFDLISPGRPNTTPLVLPQSIPERPFMIARQ